MLPLEGVRVVERPGLVQDSQHDFFTKNGRHRGNAQVHLAAVGHDVHAAFLGKPFFRNVHPADDFDA